MRLPLLRTGILSCGVWLCATVCPSAFGAGYSFANFTDNATITLVRPSEGVIPLSLLKTGTVPKEPETIAIQLTPFVNERGEVIPTHLLMPGTSTKSTGTFDPAAITVTGAVVSLGMSVDEMPLPYLYTGRIILAETAWCRRTTRLRCIEPPPVAVQGSCSIDETLH